MFVCEPQFVRTNFKYTGAVGSVMSKIRIPSQPSGLVTDVSVALLVPHTVLPFSCGVSIDMRRSRRPLCR